MMYSSYDGSLLCRPIQKVEQFELLYTKKITVIVLNSTVQTNDESKCKPRDGL